MSAHQTRLLVIYAVAVVTLAVLAVLLVWPIFLTVMGGFGLSGAAGWDAFTFQYIVGVFRDPLLVEGLVNSLWVAVGTTALSLLLALPLAMLAARFRFPGKALVTSLVLVPLILPPFVGAIGLRALLGRFGGVNALLVDVGLISADGPGLDFLGGLGAGRFLAVVVMEALHLYPILYLNLTAALANIDPALEEAADNMGAGRWSRFFRVTLPLMMPGVFAGGTIVFIWSFTELGTPLMFDYYTVTPVQVFFGLSEVASSPRPYALVVVMLAVAIGLYLVGRLVLGGRGYAMQGKAQAAGTMPTLGGVWGWLAAAAFLGVTLLAVMPHIGVLLVSVSADGAWYRTILPTEFTMSHFGAALTHPLAAESIVNSLIYSVLAMVLCVIMGLAISYLVVRLKIKGGLVLDALAMLPLAVPGLVMAFGYYAMTLRWPFPQLNAWLLGLGESTGLGVFDWLASLTQVTGQNPNPMLLLIVAYAVRRLPYIVRSASAGLEQTSGALEEAALNLGADTMTAIRRVVVPLIMANLIAGSILVFAFSMLEVSDSLILAQKAEHYPITKAIWEFFNRLGDGPYIASAMGVWGMALLTVTLVGASMLMGKKLGSIFRL
ncbi:MAG: iron ABC transporter permease [Planctomycetota bacterium]